MMSIAYHELGRKVGRILFLSVMSFFWCCSIGFGASGPEYRLTRVFSPLIFSRPVGVQQSPDNGQRWYVIQQSGQVMTFLNGDQQASVFVDVAQKITTAGGEQGLLGMAFHPSYPSVPYVYLSYTAALDGRSVISRFTKSGVGDFLEPSSEVMILQQPQPYANHNGGEIAFGPDGYLYIGLGDGGSGGDPLDNGQNTHTLLGALLRIDVNAGSPYAIPAGNPFASSTGCGSGQGCPEIYAWGFRNPWRFSFDSTSGDLWVGDVGQALWEEVDLVRAGRNYGWRCYEGTHAYNLTGCDPLASYEPPVIEYAHSDGNCSVIGGYVYRGTALPELNGIYIFGDYCSGRVWALANNGGVNTTTVLVDSNFLITSFFQGNDGEIYLSETGGGIYMLKKAPPLVPYLLLLND